MPSSPLPNNPRRTFYDFYRRPLPLSGLKDRVLSAHLLRSLPKKEFLFKSHRNALTKHGSSLSSILHLKVNTFFFLVNPAPISLIAQEYLHEYRS